jgi:hypothetical protein
MNSIKKVLLALGLCWLLAPGASAQITPNVITEKCYDMGFLPEHDYTTCPLEICITRELQCNNQECMPEGFNQYRVCRTIWPFSGNQICYNVFEEVSDPMGCTQSCQFVTTKVTVRRTYSGETITLLGANVTNFMSFFETTTSGSITLGYFKADCQGNLLLQPTPFRFTKIGPYGIPFIEE